MLTLSTVRAKLILIVSLLSVGMVIIGLIGLGSTKRANSGMEEMYNNNLVPVVQITTVRASINAIVRELAFAAIHDPANQVSKLHDHPVTNHTESVEKALGEITKLWTEYEKTIDSPEEKKLADAFNTTKNEFIDKTVSPALDNIKSNNFGVVNELIFKGGTAQAKKAAGDAQLLLEFQLKQAKDLYQSSNASYQKMIGWSVASIIIGVILAVIIGFLIIRSITKSTRSLMETAAHIEQGDLTARCNMSGTDEMSQIAKSFDQIASTFTSSINNLTAIASEVTAAASKVHMSSETLAAGSEQVASETTTVATAGEEMAATSGDIAKNCQLAAESASQASEQANHGSTIIKNSIAVMERIAQRVSESAKTVGSLGEKSEQIGAIIGTIQDIADQTNLLALNAAIEAARAGEQGRGFAVVADEVRALAERTTKATKEIDTMIKSIQQETKTAVSSMEEGVVQVEQGTQEAARSGEAIDSILAQISNLSMQVSQIATAAEEQTATTSEISGNMQRITDVVRQSSQSAHESSVEASRLNTLAESLMADLNKFTIEENVALSLKKAKSAHMIFTGKIRAHLSGATRLDPNNLPTHLTCAFGKWCQGTGKELCGHQQLFREIEGPHAKVHDLGKQAVLAFNNGDTRKAHEYCDEMILQSEYLIDMLDRLSNENV
ncbi:MCP four helix bundle domain-containing protein [Geobacter pelophilus]|uniref:MCP four helix bundle domain-containing protein n=1 Tax=Geoanaerobacter pelophilus TaxID=60036 RepID=A0AAW4LH63_9BACT|nr:methyl-accepting chemotaxis protein [Geoanaerobacter pelophilus]MBT0666491.1 MCP four helix bundle domain-containing protein [Geoanaerobacter pelophilus]